LKKLVKKINTPTKEKRKIEEITALELEYKDRNIQIEKLTESACFNFISLTHKTTGNKFWNINTIFGGSGSGKTRLAITAVKLIRDELTKKRDHYIAYIDAKLKYRKEGSSEAESIYENLVECLQEKKNLTVHFYLSNGDCIDDLKMNTFNGLLFSLMSKLYFPHINILNIKKALPTSIDLFTSDNVSKEFVQQQVSQMNDFADTFDSHNFGEAIAQRDLKDAANHMSHTDITLRAINTGIKEVQDFFKFN